MDIKPTLSVHILTYNCENYIEDTLKSVLKQETSFKFEIVIGDDNSTDKTNSILRQYATKYSSLINYKQNKIQLGILKNFKATLDRCTGNFVFALAGDDMLKHEYSLEKMVNAHQKKQNLGFIDSGYDAYYDRTKKTNFFKNKSQMFCSAEDYKNNTLLGQIIPIGICYNKDAIYKFVDFDTYIKKNIAFEDYPILVDLIMNSSFDRIKEPLVVYRIHSQSFSNSTNFKIQLSSKNQMLKLVKYFSKKYKLPEFILASYKQLHYTGCLHLSSVYGKSKLGKSSYKKLKKPFNLKLYLYYLCSQYSLVRKLIHPFRKI